MWLHNLNLEKSKGTLTLNDAAELEEQLSELEVRRIKIHFSIVANFREYRNALKASSTSTKEIESSTKR